MALIIAVDGPVGAGKSTLSDALAAKLGILHLDTGAMYRAVGVVALQKGLDPRDEAQVSRMISEGIRVSVRLENGGQRTFVDGKDVSDLIRTQEGGAAASAVSRYASVRSEMVRQQRLIAGSTDMVVDGRDIGTVVFPDATVKIYLTASLEERAKRRFLQLDGKEPGKTLEDIRREVESRDRQDMNRAIDPLRQAEDAVVVDSSEMTFDETVQAMLGVVEAKAHRGN